jgi:GDPmannose 4,6-dehydratase
LEKVQPEEIYNLGAQSHVKVSFELPVYTCDADGLGTLRLLDAIKDEKLKVKFYQAGSSEMFGLSLPPQNEDTPFHPRSPYACAKIFSHNICVNYREAYGMYICNGILFNHESPRRGFEFVTRKISSAVAKIKFGLAKEIRLGNLEAKRDWGFAGDYVEAMWLMLQQNKPDDYVIATGETHTVKEFVQCAFKHAGLDWKKYVKVDKNFYRPAEVHILMGDYSKAHKKLGWKPRIKFKELVKMMVDADLESLSKAKY